MFVPDGLKSRFGGTRFVEQIHCAQTHEGGARDDTISVQNVVRPECLCHSFQLHIRIFLRDLVKMSTNNHLGPQIEAVRDKFREAPPVPTGKFRKGDNRDDFTRVGCHETHERFKIGLGKVDQA